MSCRHTTRGTDTLTGAVLTVLNSDRRPSPPARTGSPGAWATPVTPYFLSGIVGAQVLYFILYIFYMPNNSIFLKKDRK